MFVQLLAVQTIKYAFIASHLAKYTEYSMVRMSYVENTVCKSKTKKTLDTITFIVFSEPVRYEEF